MHKNSKNKKELELEFQKQEKNKFLTNLVDFVNVHNAVLGRLNVEVGRLQDRSDHRTGRPGTITGHQCLTYTTYIQTGLWRAVHYLHKHNSASSPPATAWPPPHPPPASAKTPLPKPHLQQPAPGPQPLSASANPPTQDLPAATIAGPMGRWQGWQTEIPNPTPQQQPTCSSLKMMASTSSPTYPACVSVVASAMANGTLTSLASVLASSVLPEPVGPCVWEVGGNAQGRSSSRAGEVTLFVCSTWSKSWLHRTRVSAARQLHGSRQWRDLPSRQ